MKDQDKTKEQLIRELADLRHRITELEASATADRQADESLRKAEASWRSLVENAPEKITSLDRDGTILFINRTTLGHTVEEVIGTSIYNYLPPAEQDNTRRVLESVFRSGQIERYETVDVGPDGIKVVRSKARSLRQFSSPQTSPSASGQKRRYSAATRSWPPSTASRLW
jgi:PAS domain S-box-containing protein